ncbi:MAG: SPFH domain-containing protein, partial [Gemmatimonadota bacterium]
MLKEKPYGAANGYVALLMFFVVLGVAIWQLLMMAQAENVALVVIWSVVLVLAALGFAGLFTVQPNEAKALVLFGAYRGSVRKEGFWWANPFVVKRRVSLRARN